jgi:FHA domain
VNVRELAAKARELGRARFSAEHANLFVLITRSAPAEEAASFWTEAASEDEIHAGLELTTIVAPLVKKAGNPYPDRISIGRARNCDVPIADPSLSKLHAHVRPEGGAWVLVDLGSQNGTFVAGKALRPNEPVPLRAGDEVTFGVVRGRVFDAAGLFDALASLGAWR